MELKVWVEGIQRIVCGVSVNTTCQDVVFALAHATGKVGRFTLIERWRHNERLLAPQENPLKLLLKWGEYASDVQFILQRSENKQQRIDVSNDILNDGKNRKHNSGFLKINNANDGGVADDSVGGATPDGSSKLAGGQNMNSVMLKKPLGLSNTNNNNNSNINCNYNSNSKTNSNSSNSIVCAYNAQQQQHDAKQNENNIGIVRGIQQQQPQNIPLNASPIALGTPTSTMRDLPNLIPRHEKSHSNPIELVASGNTHPSSQRSGAAYNELNKYVGANNNNYNNNNLYGQLGAYNSKSTNEINLAVMRDSLDRRAMPGEFGAANHSNNSQHAFSSNENLLDCWRTTPPDSYNSKNAPQISANGALVPPPYRDPPPPRNSPMQQQPAAVLHHRMQTDAVAAPTTNNPFLSDCQPRSAGAGLLQESGDSESIFRATQYNDLLQLIKFQREKISAQQMELSKYDAEIVYLESKEREQAQELEAISREITKADQIFRQGSEQLQTLQYVEEENELVKQQEKTLKSEIALLRSKLANCETELLQCKNKIRLLMDDIEVEQQRAINSKQKSNRQNVERDFLLEMERIQSEIDQAIHNTDTSNKTTDSLKKEILLIENAIAEKKRQVEQLVNEMKAVNLQCLTVTTSEEIKHLLEGSNKPGSSRRIIGSPRQLENAVPTSKNPHGVWV